MLEICVAIPSDCIANDLLSSCPNSEQIMPLHAINKRAGKKSLCELEVEKNH